MASSAVSGRQWSMPKTIVAFLMAIPFVYPLVFLVMTSMRSANSYYRSPLGFSGFPVLNHIRYAWDAANLAKGAENSLIVVPIGVAICCSVSSMAAFWFFRHRGLIARAMLGLILVGWIVPFAVYLVPFYVELVRFGLTDNLFMLGVTYGAIYVPFGTYFILAYLRQALSPEILEAAEVDGASILAIFLRIVLPLTRPALGTLAALTFVWVWGEIIVAVVLVGTDPAHWTIILSAESLVGQTLAAGSGANTTQTVAAGALISLLPMLSVVYFAQRAIIRGFGSGGVKG